MTTIIKASLTRLAEFLLARLLVTTSRSTPPSRLREEISRLLPAPLTAERWRSLVKKLASAGLITARPLRLTDAGRACALEFLGLDDLPARLNWRRLRDRYLVPRALEIPESATQTRARIASLDGLGAWLLKRRNNLPEGAAQSMQLALEALACRQLGFPEEISLKAAGHKVLCRLLGLPESATHHELARAFVQEAVAARRSDLASLREAVLREWLAGDEDRPLSLANGQTESASGEAFDLPAFAATVRALTRTCPTGRFGDNKVFIHHVWKQMQGETHLPLHSLDQFKQRLVEAHRAGLLHLGRADLVQTLDPSDVVQSETRYLDAVFHFILTEGEQL